MREGAGIRENRVIVYMVTPLEKASEAAILFCIS